MHQHAVYPKFSKLSNISSADIISLIWSHFEKTNSMQTVIARLPNNQKSWTWPFLAMACWGENSNSKNILQIQVFIKVSCLKGVLLAGV